RRDIRAAFGPEQIRRTAQAPSRRLRETVERGVLFSCCSLHQLDRYGTELPGRDVTLRVNPGLGSGSTNRTNTGGPASSFGIWHEYLGDVRAAADRHDLKSTRLHNHIGSRADPAGWQRAIRLTLARAGQR